MCMSVDGQHFMERAWICFPGARAEALEQALRAGGKSNFVKALF